MKKLNKSIQKQFARKRSYDNQINCQKNIFTIEGIKRTVCDFFEVNINAIDFNRKLKKLVIPRQVIQFIVYNGFGYSLAKTGLLIGNRKHAGVLHSMKSVCNQYMTDKYYRAIIDAIGFQLNFDMNYHIIQYMKTHKF